MLSVNSPSAVRPFSPVHSFRGAPQNERGGVELCELVSERVSDASTTNAPRLRLPNEPTHCAGSELRLEYLVIALVAMANRESPQGLGSELSIERLPTHALLTVTSDRFTQTPELGPIFEAFNAYSASLSKADEAFDFTPSMKIVSCADRRFSRISVALPYALA